jgi:hypothetical protein
VRRRPRSTRAPATKAWQAISNLGPAMLDATETVILISIFALAALLILVPRALARRTRGREE